VKKLAADLLSVAKFTTTPCLCMKSKFKLEDVAKAPALK
jgi:hypothetical protein